MATRHKDREESGDCPLDKKAEKKLEKFKNNVHKKIYRPTKDGLVWRIKNKKEIVYIFNIFDIVEEANN